MASVPQTCDYRAWDICADDNTAVTLRLVVCALSYAYFAYVMRRGANDKRYLYLRWATFVNITAVCIQVVVDRYNGEVPVLSPLLEILNLGLAIIVISQWVYNILDTTFSALTFTVKSSGWIFKVVWVNCVSSVLTTVILLIGIAASGSSCPPWLLAKGVYYVIVTILLTSPLVMSYFTLFYLVREHLAAMKSQFPATSNHFAKLERAKSQIGRTSSIAFGLAVIFSAASAYLLTATRTDPFGATEACDPFSSGLEFVTRFALFCAPLRHTHVIRPSNQRSSSKRTIATTSSKSGTPAAVAAAATAAAAGGGGSGGSPRKSTTTVAIHMDDGVDDDGVDLASHRTPPQDSHSPPNSPPSTPPADVHV